MNDERRDELTTHAERGAGHPRLLVSSEDQTQFVFEIPPGGATIGSGGDCTLKLPGAELLHAEIDHDTHDEYILTMHAEGETSANLEKAAEEERRSDVQLRTGARFTAGPWQLVYVRDEFADHGRPFGGREGGEGSDQSAQNARSDGADAPGDDVDATDSDDADTATADDERPTDAVDAHGDVTHPRSSTGS